MSLKESASKETWIANYSSQLPEEGIHAKTVDIQTYVNTTYGQTIGQVQKAANMTKVAALLVIFGVEILRGNFFPLYCRLQSCVYYDSSHYHNHNTRCH